MPYDKPPDKIKGLPAHAQEVWMSAFNNAWKEYNGDEEKCNATAWSAVEKAGYKKNDKGEWVKEEEFIEQIKKRSKVYRDKPINEQKDAPLLEGESLGEHKYKVEIINLEPPNVPHRGWSLNERYYTEKSLKSLAEKINGKPLIASGHHRAHPEFSDLAGIYSDGQKVPGKKIVTAVAEILGVAQETVEPYVQKQVSVKNAKILALSHNSKGDTYWGTDPQNRKGDIVEDLTEVYSTDIVYLPGAGGNFQKLAEEYRRKKMIDITLKELKDENPELYKKIQEEALTESQQKIKDLEESKKKSDDELKELKEEKEEKDKGVWADELIKESGLTEKQAKGLKEEMVKIKLCETKEKTKEEMGKLIEARKDYLRGIAEDLKIKKMTFDRSEKKEVSLNEEEKKAAKKAGISEESFLKSKQLMESGKTLEEAGISFVKEEKK